MIIRSIDQAVYVPYFSEEIVGRVIVDFQEDPRLFRKIQLGTMEVLNPTLGDFYQEKLAAVLARNQEDEARRWGDGYLVGHCALRSGVMPKNDPLPKRNRESLHAIAKFAHEKPDEFTELVDTDYQQHPQIGDLLAKLAGINDGDVSGAFFVLSAHGRWVNRNRPPLRLSTEGLIPRQFSPNPPAIRPSGTRRRMRR